MITMVHHDCRRLISGASCMAEAHRNPGLHALPAAMAGFMPTTCAHLLMCCLMAQVWEDAVAADCDPDSRMCTTLLEVCTRKGDTKRALGMYERMRDAPAGSRLSPSVHAFVSAMRAAADSGAWEKALSIWDDMVAANCQPTGARTCLVELLADFSSCGWLCDACSCHPCNQPMSPPEKHLKHLKRK